MIMFAELKALVALAGTGSMERAANDLYLTPSAFTRRIQRLEDELGVVLLDRHFKPPKLTQAGFEVLDKSRAILSSLSELKASTSGNTAPVGPFRLGLSHAVAQPDISEVIIELGRQFPLLQPSICNDISCQLLARLHLGELDGAIVVVPVDTALPQDLEGVTLSLEPMRLVQARTAAQRKSRCAEFYRRNWVLNPAGCLVREELKTRVERLGAPLRVAAELHNPDLQLSLIAGNVGVGMLRASSLRTHALRTRLSIIEHPNFDISIRIAFFRGRYLGTRELVAVELQRMLVKHFEGARLNSSRQPIFRRSEKPFNRSAWK
ncbi:MAG: LysR family transcriptional regulator [Candidatus Acidiferrum sp.]